MKLASFSLLLLVACSSAEEKKPHDAEITAAVPPAVSAVSADTVSEQPIPREIAFDIPALLGKNIDAITQILGKPSEADASNMSADELERRYTKKGYRLVINYDKKNRQVAGFFLSAPEPQGETNDCSKILEAGNLNPTSASYAIDTLRSERKGYFTGVVVTTE